jgi:hypothetical protein
MNIVIREPPGSGRNEFLCPTEIGLFMHQLANLLISSYMPGTALDAEHMAINGAQSLFTESVI